MQIAAPMSFITLPPYSIRLPCPCRFHRLVRSRTAHRYLYCFRVKRSSFQMEVVMTIVRKLLVGPLMVMIAASSTAFAGQQHAVTPDQLAAALSARAAQQDADRAAI